MNKTKYSIDRTYEVLIGNSWCPCVEKDIKINDTVRMKSGSKIMGIYRCVLVDGGKDYEAITIKRSYR